MTKEERAEKWFRAIANADAIPIEKKIEICNRTAIRMIILFFLVLTAECVLLFTVNDGKIFNRMADFTNSFTEGSHSYRSMALLGAAVWSPLIPLPYIASVLLRRKWISSEAKKLSVK